MATTPRAAPEEARPTDLAAMQAAGLAPVPFKRTTPADVPGCEGFTNSVSRRSPGLCYRCASFGHNGSSWIAPALTLKAGEASCPNWSPLISADQIAATDDMAGLHGACTVRSKADAGQSAERGGEVAASTRAGEGG